MAIDSKLQRQIMGRFATGVTVVTTRCGEELLGMTANAVMSLSLDPPLVVVAVDRKSRMCEGLAKGGCFAMNILRAEHEEISNRFARSGPKDFSDIATMVGETGAPIFADALAYLDCRLVDTLAGGDHDIFLGEPVRGKIGEGEPLIFYSGGYTRLVSEET